MYILQKSFLSFLLVVGVVVLGVCWYMYANHQIPGISKPVVTDMTIMDTTSWSTYTNAQYGFSFKYPPSLRVMESVQSDIYGQVLIVSLVSEKVSNNEVENSSPMGVTVRELDKEKAFTASIGNINNKQNIVINSIPTTLYDSTIVIRGKGVESKFNEKTAVFNLGTHTYSAAVSGDSSFDQYFYTMLTTFKN